MIVFQVDEEGDYWADESHISIPDYIKGTALKTVREYAGRRFRKLARIGFSSRFYWAGDPERVPRYIYEARLEAGPQWVWGLHKLGNRE